MPPLESGFRCLFFFEMIINEPRIGAHIYNLFFHFHQHTHTQKQIRDVFEGLGKIKEVRSDVGGNWFVTMEDEATAKEALLKLRFSGAKIKDAAVKARLKSANLLRGGVSPPSSGSRSVGTNYNDKDFKGIVPMYPQPSGSYYMPPYMARMPPMFPGPYPVGPYGMPPQQQQRFNKKGNNSNQNNGKNKNNGRQRSQQQYGRGGHSSRRAGPSDGRKR